MRRGKQQKPQGNNGNRKPKTGSKKPSPLANKNNRGGFNKNHRSSARDDKAFNQRLSEREFTWTVDPDTKDVVIKTPLTSTAKKLASSFPPTVKFQVGEKVEEEPWDFESDESEDEEYLEFQKKLDAIISEDSESDDEEDSEVDSDLELQFQSYEDNVLQSGVVNDDLVMDYIQNLALYDKEKPFVIIHENYDMDTLKSTEPEKGSPVSSTRKAPNNKQRKRQSLPGIVEQQRVRPKRNVRSAQNSPSQSSPIVKAAKMKQWYQGEVMTDSRPKETPSESKKLSKEEVDEDNYDFDEESDSDDDRLPGQYGFSSSDSEDEIEIDDRIDMAELFGKKKRAGGPQSPVTKYEIGYKQRFSMRDLHSINNLLRDFIKDEHSGECMPFAPMSKIQRFQLSRIGTFYGLKNSNLGAGKRMYPQLTKTSFTKLVAMETSTTFLEEVFFEAKSQNYDDIENIKKNGGKSKKSKNSPNDNNYNRNGGKNKNKSSMKRNKYEKFSKKKKEPKSYEGTPISKGGGLVGQHANPIADSNLGNKLLRSMGWSGGGLGPKGEGITNPIDAVIKHDKRGLGFERHSSL